LNRLKKPISYLLLSLTLSAADAASNTQRISITPQVFTLDNGLTTVVHSDPSAPNVFVGVWYRVGSKDEPTGKTGFAHLFEHLMFQPTRNRAGEYFLPLAQAGATDMNGVTDSDRTLYYQTVPSNALDLALWMESDRMAHLGQSITQALLDEQRAVVKNEKLQGELGSDGTPMRYYREHFYPAGHPYAHDTIGSMQDLDNASLADVKQWFKEYYGASNAVLVLSGNIDPATAKQKVTHYFSDVPAGRPAPRLQQWLPEFAQIKRDVVYQPSQSASIRRAWPIANDDPRQLTVLQLVAGTLAGADNTFLQQRLVSELKLASKVTAGLARNQLSSTFSIYLTLLPGVDPQQAGQALDQALADYFSKRTPDRKRIQAIILNSDNSLLRSLESPATIGMLLGEGQLYDNAPMRFQQQRQWAQQTTPNELQQISRRWLEQPYYETLLLPLPATTTAKPGSVDRSQLPSPGPYTDEVKFPPITRTTLSNGLQLVVAQRHQLPLIDASMQFDTGSDADAGYVPGIASQAFKLLSLGTQHDDASALAQRMGQSGVSFNAAVSNRQSGFNWSMRSDHAEQGFALAAELLRHPRYPQAEIDKRIAGLDVDRYFDALEQQPINAAGEVFARALWGKDHPNGRITTREDGHRNHRRQHSHELLQRFHDHELGPNNATLYVLGDITLEQARALAERHFGDWKPVTPSALEDSTRAAPHSGARVILIDVPGAQQSSIHVGHLIAALDPEQAATEALMDAVLGSSFNSRLNMNLREAKGWSYGFTAGIGNNPQGPRVFSASGNVQADMTAPGMLQIRNEIADYVGSRPATAAELQREQAAAIRAIPSSFTNGGAFLASMISSHSYGLPYDHAESAMQRLRAVTLEQLHARARASYHPEQLIWVVAGDLKRIEADIRALNFGPVEVQDVYGNTLR
jgi:zinc protease